MGIRRRYTLYIIILVIHMKTFSLLFSLPYINYQNILDVCDTFIYNSTAIAVIARYTNTKITCNNNPINATHINFSISRNYTYDIF